jgi:CxxC motif-containing protein (DUF1111 family)
MSRKLVLIVALTLFAVGLTLATQAQQQQTVAPRVASALVTAPPVPAPAGFNDKTNGFADQDQFDKDRAAFEDVETILARKATAETAESKGGLGPVYNATSCVTCHQNPITGSSSQVTEIRAGSTNAKGEFVEPPGGSLIHQRAIDPQIQEHVRDMDNVRVLRLSTNTLGNGFVEVIQDQTILDVCKKQPKEMRGKPIAVPVAVRVKAVADGQPADFDFVFRIGRFGWKTQEASLLNFSAGAYLNEMGITNPLQPTENLSNGRDVTQFDPVADPEDEAKAKPNVKPTKHEDFENPFGEDVEAFARFMRSTKVPPRDFAVAQGAVCVADDDPDKAKKLAGGEKVFHDLNCAVCHKPQYITPPKDTVIKPLSPLRAVQGTDFNDGKVPDALGNKIICPFSDFMLHNIGTKDGIVQTQHAQRAPLGAAQLLQFGIKSQLLQELATELATCDTLDVVAEVATGNVESVRPAERTLGSAASITARTLDQSTANMSRTAPLWGLRVRPQLLHDGSALTIEDAILRHGMQAQASNDLFVALKAKAQTDATAAEDLRNFFAFLNSL